MCQLLMKDIKDMNHLLEVKGLNKSFKSDLFKKSQEVLKNISFKIDSGKFVGLIGPNGAGKTTLLKCILNFLHPDSGEVLLFGEQLGLKQKRRLGYLPERPYFQDFLTGQEFLKLHWTLSGSPSNFQKRALEIFELVNLINVQDKKLKSYSKGMLQRIGLGQALIANPEFLILDEPMSGLDPDGRILFKEILKKLKTQRISTIMSSHLLEDIEELCEELIVMHHGQVVYTGLLINFKKNYSSLEEAYRHFKIDIK